MKLSEWVLWVDMDAIFTNFSIRIESFIPDESCKLILSKDSHRRKMLG